MDMDKIEKAQKAIELYHEVRSTHKVGDMLGMCHRTVSKILRENNVEMENIGKGKTVCGEVVDEMVKDYTVNHMKMEEISAKYGVYTKKLRRIFKERGVSISKWNGHVKKEKAKKTKKVKESKPTMKCRYCEWETSDRENKAHAYIKHIVKCHKSVREYLEDYPGDIDRVGLYKDRENMVKCEICGAYRKIIDNRHLRKHGYDLSSYYSLYGEKKRVSDLTKEKLRRNHDCMMNNENWERATSNGEKEITNFLTLNGVEVSRHDREVLDGLEIDIVCRDKKIGIEYDGLLWHTEWFGKKNHMYHLEKTLKANKNGYKLIHIFEDEYVGNKDLILKKVLRIVGGGDKLEKVMGRKCVVEEIQKNEGYRFLCNNHIQGFVNSGVVIGCRHEGRLVGVMTFTEEKPGEWNLTRYATDNDLIVQGGGGKLLSFFIKKYNPKSIKTFADRRWTVDKDDNIYTKIGFRFDGATRPNYTYYYRKDNKIERFHKFGFRKQILAKKHGFPMTMTETEMVKELGYDRIWDCGLFKYVWTRE